MLGSIRAPGTAAGTSYVASLNLSLFFREMGNASPKAAGRTERENECFRLRNSTAFSLFSA